MRPQKRAGLRFALLPIVGSVVLVACANSGGEVADPGSSPADSPQGLPSQVSPSPTPIEGTPEAFIPSTHTENGLEVLPITFPDGSTAELVYPPALDIAGMGRSPIGWAAAATSTSTTTTPTASSTTVIRSRRTKVLTASRCRVARR